MREKGRRYSAGIQKMRKQLRILKNRTENLVEKVKNDVFEEYEPGEKEEAGNCNTLPNTYSCFSILLPTENASYYSPILYSLISFIQDTFSSRDP